MPKFLNNVPPFLFFTGKGGVGKTSLACASAIKLASMGKRTLLVSTDPASNIGQVFGLSIGNTIKAIPDVDNLFALEIDPQAAAQQYRENIVAPVRDKLPEAIVKGIEEQLSGACTTEIAAFDEFTALLTDSELLATYDHIVFDTAPTGHTIRLLQLPGAWTNFLDEGKGNASCLGPLSGLQKQREQYKQAVNALADPQRTRLILVARAQAATLHEVARTHQELGDIGLSQQFLVINGEFPEHEVGSDTLAKAVWQREQQVLAELPEALKLLPIDHVPLKPFNLVGIAALQQLLTKQSSLSAIQTPVSHSTDVPYLADLVDEIAVDQHGLIMLMGKGGVGKTTLAAAVAVELAQRGFPVHLTTSDPAAHLMETVLGAQNNLTVSRIDPQVETDRYRQEILAAKGEDLDAQGRAMLEEDLRSPCTEEIAVFQAFSRVIREAGKKFVVMDTAPTGHTLLLLDATGAYHREVSRQMDSKGLHFTTPMMQLQDPKQTKVLIVTLAEQTPILEAANLQTDLRRAGIEPWAWVINNSLMLSTSTSPLLQQRALNEQQFLAQVTEQHAKRWAVVPLQLKDPAGITRLQQLCRH